MRARFLVTASLLCLATASGHAADECRAHAGLIPSPAEAPSLAQLRAEVAKHLQAQEIERRQREDALAALSAPGRPGDLRGASGMLAPGGGPSMGLSEKVTYEYKGRRYTAEVVRGMPRDRVIEMLKAQQAEEDRIGPERHALLLAIQSGKPQAVRAALAKRPDLQRVQDRRGQVIGVVALAAFQLPRTGHGLGDQERQRPTDPSDVAHIVRLLVDAGADPNQPLHAGDARLAIDAVASASPHPAVQEIAALLLDRGAALRSANPYPSSLQVAVERGNDALLVVMLQRGRPAAADVQLALRDAVQGSRIESTLALLQAGGDPRGITGAMNLAVRQRSRALLEALARAQVDVNDPIVGGKPPLFSVLHDEAWMQALFALGADANAKGAPNGHAPPVATALHGATSRNGFLARWYGPGMAEPAARARMVALLLRQRADPNAVDGEGNTPLMQTLPEDVEAIRLLIDAGGRVVPPTNLPFPVGPVSWAIHLGNDPLGAALAQRRGVQADDCGAVYYAARAGAMQTLRIVATRELRHRVLDSTGETPLIAAAGSGHLEAVRLLLDRGVGRIDEGTEPAVKMSLHASVPPAGVTPLMAATRGGHLEVVRTLLARGARTDLKDSWGRAARDHVTGATPDGERIRALVEGRAR